MMWRQRTALVLLGLSTLMACGDDKPQAAVLRMDAGYDSGPPDAGPPDTGPLDAGTEDAGPPCSDPLAPTVAMTAPNPAADPVDDEVLTGRTLTASCTAMGSPGIGARPLEASSVRIELMTETMEVIASPSVTEEEPGVFTADFDLTTAPHGVVAFRCYAEDAARPARCGHDFAWTYVDHGPRLEILSPLPMDVHSSHMNVRFQVTPRPLTDADTEGEVASIELVVAGRVIDATVEAETGDYVAIVDFEDRTVFTEPLSGLYNMSVTVINARTPTAVEAFEMVPFVVDSEGPTIVIDQPDVGELVGGLVLVEATITDTGGVDPDTVRLLYRDLDIPMTLKPGTSNVYVATFDAAGFGRTVQELTLNVAANDLPGNGSTVSRIVKLDSTPPAISLDPPSIREMRMVGGVLQCSQLMDPVGEDSVADGMVVGTAPEFRVRVQDLGNSSFGGTGTAVFNSGVDEESVELWILDDTSIPLLVDADGDGICDAINPAVDPATSTGAAAVIVDLDPVRPNLKGDFREDLNVTDPGAPFGICNPGTATTPDPPDNLCITTPLWSTISHTHDRATSAIFVKPPITAMWTCMGDAWDFQGSISEGWACVVAVSTDNLGNVGVSPPERVCFRRDLASTACPGLPGDIVDESLRPSCTASCTAPDVFADVPGLQLIGYWVL